MSLRRRVYDHFVICAGERMPVADQHFVVPSPHPLPGDHEDFVGHDEAPERPCVVPRPRTPPGIAVLCAPADAPALGAALALAVAGRFGAPVVAVCAWSGAEPARRAWRAPALPGARRLAAGLAARGHQAHAAGRLAVVQLAPGCEEAAAEARRAIAAAAPLPAVVALGGPRARAFDELLAEQDLVVVATRSGAEPALARLAVASLADSTVAAQACEIPSTPSARTLAAAGLTLLPSARRALAGPVQAL
jgi:hypothetical protein